MENKKLNMALLVLILASTLIHGVAAREDMQTFFELRWPGIKIQLNSTKEALPGENITVVLHVKGEADGVYVECLNLTIFGFIRGQNKTLLMGMYQGNFSLNYNETKEYADSFVVPEDVWDTTYGELSFKYSIGGFSYSLSPIGFTMTHVKNVLLESLEEQLENLNKTYEHLKEKYTELDRAYSELNESYAYVSGCLQTLQQNYTQLNETYAALNQTYWELKESLGGLETAGNVMYIFLATTVVFVATTAYLILKKPKTY